MKILNINMEPIIRTYAHHLFLHSIVSNNDKIGTKRARIEILSRNNSSLINHKNSALDYNSNYIELNADIYEKYPDSHIIYKKCDKIDELLIKVEYQQYINPLGNINFFVANLFDLDIPGKFDFLVQKNCNNSVIVYYDNIKKFLDYKHNQLYPYWMKISICNSIISAEISFDGGMWEEISKYTIPENQCNQKIIGIDINLDDNNYFNWIFTNYVQLKANINALVPIDYMVSPYKNYRNYTYNPLVNFIHERREIIKKQYETIFEFVRMNIDCDRYIEVYLNEYYIPDRLSYQKNLFEHPNLIYGYDDDCIYLLGVDGGRPIKTKLSNEDFLYAFEACERSNDIIYIFDYLPDQHQNGLSLNQLSHLSNSIKDYLLGIFQNVEFYNIPDYKNDLFETNVSFGIKVYDEFTNENGINKIINDVRVSYFLHEHKICMKERINFLLKRGILNYNDCEEIIINVDELCSISTTLLNIIIKNKMKKRSNRIEEKIKKHLVDMKNIELYYYPILSDLLKNYINEHKKQLKQ